ncbi:unnamed protein product [Meloidogyne enterolobii]|uniref:Uncharacterized protein n=1 Tax=Meloidogyne enterolobii TaxID=390850 RepID=A0ACB1A996_MELEN
MKRRHSLSNRQTRYSNDQLNEFCTNGSNYLSSEQVIKRHQIIKKGHFLRNKKLRWLKYSVAGLTPIEGTRFIAFKTPLHPYFFASEVTERHRFDVDAIVNHMASQNKTLGLVIDLTDTNRYYDPTRWIRHKVINKE